MSSSPRRLYRFDLHLASLIPRFNSKPGATETQML
jgi:hypothetical protein